MELATNGSYDKLEIEPKLSALASRQGGVGEDRVLETRAVRAWF